jgi:hypothetical protein
LRFQTADLRPFAVRSEVTKIATSSSASFSSALAFSGCVAPLSMRSSSQKSVSSASSRTIPSLETKSAVDLARHTARYFAPTEVAERNSWRVMTVLAWLRGRLWHRRIAMRAKLLVRRFRSSEVVGPATKNLKSKICNLKCTHFAPCIHVTSATSLLPITVDFPPKTVLIASV